VNGGRMRAEMKGACIQAPRWQAARWTGEWDGKVGGGGDARVVSRVPVVVRKPPT